MGEAVLELKNIQKRFPGVVALKGIDLEVRAHEILGLVGENGAGKSTLMKILVGLQRPDPGGQFLLRGRPVVLDGPEAAIRNGIGMVFQEGAMIPNLSVLDNLFLCHEDPFTRGGLLSQRRMAEKARTVLAGVGLEGLDPRAPMGELSAAQKQMVEIARLLWMSEHYGVENPILILDEPTTVLQDAEVRRLFAILNELKKRASIIFISHRLEEVVQHSDRVYVLKDGAHVGTLERTPGMDPQAPIAEVPRVVQMMVGHELSAEHYRESMQTEPGQDVVLRVRGLHKEGLFRDFSLDLRAGEIVGLVGLLGSGKEAVCRCLMGAERPDGGTIEVGGKRVRFRSPKDAIRVGIGCVPIDRRSEGLATSLDVAENVNLLVLRGLRLGPFLDPRRERANAERWATECLVKTPSLRAQAGNLSGGNQQKVVIAKWLAAHVRILILDHPTRGIDVGAKDEIYARIRTLAASGMSLLIMCDTLEEDIGLSNRLLVMKDGAVVRELSCAAREKPSPVEVVSHVV
ncbi:MAG TPA: sugar ABC transporter ATP-binding protein [Anaeromyxobacter sp.]|nr:sugar ABC transporter ATP-binding protein [Anaeromyxobacter sp.]